MWTMFMKAYCVNVVANIKEVSILTLSVPEKLKNLLFEIPIIPQTLNINNLLLEGLSNTL